MVVRAAQSERVRRSMDSVLKATHELLRSSGLSGISVDEISRRSGVAKTTIYRHWPSRSALVLDACAHMASPLGAPDTGSLRGDLLALASEIARQLQAEAWASIAPSVMDAAEHDQDIADVQALQHNALLAPFRTVLERAKERGEQSLPESAEIVASILGPLFYRRWMSREQIDGAFVERVVDRALG